MILNVKSKDVFSLKLILDDFVELNSPNYEAYKGEMKAAESLLAQIDQALTKILQP